MEEASGSGAAEGTWAGEGYEKASQLSADAAFHRYAKQLRRQPDQCLRLAAGDSKLLWPQSKPPPLERWARWRAPTQASYGGSVVF